MRLFLVFTAALFLISCAAREVPDPAATSDHESSTERVAGSDEPAAQVRYIKEYHDLQHAYAELLSFKDEEDFHQEGFSGVSKYSQWFEEVTDMLRNPASLGGSTGPRLLRQLGLFYARGQGEESQFTQALRSSMEELLRELMIERDSVVTLAYTGDTRGHIRPVRACCVIMGGLAARAHALNAVHENESNVLLLDNGNTLETRGDAADKTNRLMIEAMNRMEYAVMGLGPLEMQLDDQTLRSLFAQAQFAVVATNLVADGDAPAWFAPYALEQIQGHRIGVLSVQPVPEGNQQRRIAFIAPEEALARYLPEVRKNSDTVVLLSQLGGVGTRKILESLPEIDVVIYQSNTSITEEAVLLGTGIEGQGLGILQFIPSREGMQPARHELLKLDMANVYYDEDMQSLVDATLGTPAAAD